MRLLTALISVRSDAPLGVQSKHRAVSITAVNAHSVRVCSPRGAGLEVRCREHDEAASVRVWLDAVGNSGETTGTVAARGELGALSNLGAWPAAAAAA